MMKLAESILITGANRGIGLELVRQIAASHSPNYIFAVCRNPKDAVELNKLAAAHNSIKILPLSDYKDYTSYDKLTQEVEQHVGNRGLNVLINNAGVAPKGSGLSEVTPTQMMDTFELNSVAPLMFAKTFKALLERAAAVNSSLPLSCARSAIINVSSQMGSIADNGIGGFYPYRASKAALNIITKSLSVDLQASNVLVTSLHPGWVKTDMGSERAPMVVEDSVRQIIEVLIKLEADKNGAFVNYKNEVLPW